jgi:hypothetical protein
VLFIAALIAARDLVWLLASNQLLIFDLSTASHQHRWITFELLALSNWTADPVQRHILFSSLCPVSDLVLLTSAVFCSECDDEQLCCGHQHGCVPASQTSRWLPSSISC